jgi:Ca2+-binding EF-hand superfamily protein
MRRKDQNSNGQLDPDEIALGWPVPPEDFDTDENGIITITELASQFAIRRRMRREMGIEAVDQTEAIRIKNDHDANGDGKLGADEWNEASLPRDGKKFDENGDGFLSLMEVATLLAKHRMESGLTTTDQAQARQLIRSVDADQDGKISQDELERMETLGGRFRELEQYDTNKNGEITLAEVEKVFSDRRKEKGYDATELAAAQRLMTRHDTNRSNMLESDELIESPGPGQLSADRFKSIDANHDDRIDLDELARYVAKEEK